eukprot:516854-Rhodomonas_salina.1
MTWLCTLLPALAQKVGAPSPCLRAVLEHHLVPPYPRLSTRPSTTRDSVLICALRTGTSTNIPARSIAHQHDHTHVSVRGSIALYPRLATSLRVGA